MRIRELALGVVAGSLLVSGALLSAGLRQDETSPPTSPTRPSDQPPSGYNDADDYEMGRMLLEGLKNTPGCLGVETAQTDSGKYVIFAWFKDMNAALRWFYSDTHQVLMKQFFPETERKAGAMPEHKPMSDVPDDIGPIMAIASLTPATNPGFSETTLPVSQIAIELYTPVSGGLALGGRLAPESLQVPKLKHYEKVGE